MWSIKFWWVGPNFLCICCFASNSHNNAHVHTQTCGWCHVNSCASGFMLFHLLAGWWRQKNRKQNTRKTTASVLCLGSFFYTWQIWRLLSSWSLQKAQKASPSNPLHVCFTQYYVWTIRSFNHICKQRKCISANATQPKKKCFFLMPHVTSPVTERMVKKPSRGELAREKHFLDKRVGFIPFFSNEHLNHQRLGSPGWPCWNGRVALCAGLFLSFCRDVSRQSQHSVIWRGCEGNACQIIHDRCNLSWAPLAFPPLNVVLCWESCHSQRQSYTHSEKQTYTHTHTAKWKYSLSCLFWLMGLSENSAGCRVWLHVCTQAFSIMTYEQKYLLFLNWAWHLFYLKIHLHSHHKHGIVNMLKLETSHVTRLRCNYPFGSRNHLCKMAPPWDSSKLMADTKWRSVGI